MMTCGIDENEEHVWWRGIAALMLTGFFIRAAVAFISDNTYHPDEIFQILEQAHRAVFGYGFVPWEYRYGTRSWVTPGFIAGILTLCKWMNLDSPRIYIMAVKMVLCGFSVSLIFFSYIIGRTIASEKSGRMAAFFTCFWYELIYFAHKPLTTILATYMFIGAFACVISYRKRCFPVFCGMLAGLCIVIRIQFLPVVGCLGLYMIYRWKMINTVTAISTWLLIIFLAGMLDSVTWGSPFISFYRNVQINSFNNVSNLFGVKPFYWYIQALSASSAGLFPLVLLWGIVKLRHVWQLMVCIFIILIVHSLIGHKEYRFVYTVIPLFLITAAIVMQEAIKEKVPVKRRHRFYSLLFTTYLLLSLSGMFHRLPFQRMVYEYPLLYKNPTLTAYKILYQAKNLAGVLDFSGGWGESGGYYYLHRDVPIYYKYHVRKDLVDMAAIHEYVTHIVWPAPGSSFERFKAIASIDMIEIQEQEGAPTIKKNPLYSTNIEHRGIDGVLIIPGPEKPKP